MLMVISKTIMYFLIILGMIMLYGVCREMGKEKTEHERKSEVKRMKANEVCGLKILIEKKIGETSCSFDIEKECAQGLEKVADATIISVLVSALSGVIAETITDKALRVGKQEAIDGIIETINYQLESELKEKVLEAEKNEAK